MNRKNSIKKVAVAVVAAVSLALPFTSVCAEGDGLPKPDPVALNAQSDNPSTQCLPAPRKPVPVRRFDENNIREVRDLIVLSRRVNHALTTGDDNEIDNLIKRANLRRLQRFARQMTRNT